MRFKMAPPSKGAPISSSDVLELRGRLLLLELVGEAELGSEGRSFIRVVAL